MQRQLRQLLVQLHTPVGDQSPVSSTGSESADPETTAAWDNRASTGSGVELITQGGSADSIYPVSDFVQLAIAAAVAEVVEMRRAVWNASGAAQVERMPATRWCSHSVYPIGWELPASWDAFAGDYCAEDGWIRLHTNAAHHRQAALQVLGQPTDQRELQHRVSRWQASELEAAVVAAGGAAARMMSCSQWQDHVQGRAVNTEPIIAWQQRGRVESGDELLRFATPQRPLQGVRVLDLTRVLAGPVSTRFLAALGADVLRIDPPDWQEEGNTLEMTLGKRCAGLDLRRPDDRACFETLLASAHVLVHGYRRDALAGLGFDEVARLRANPDLIDVALNAYGWSGPWSKRRGFDSLVQMSTGIADSGMRINASDKPVPLPFQALDHATGYLMAAAIVQAIMHRATTGYVLSARLSLARQAKLLQDRPAQSAAEELAMVEERHLAPGIEETPFGPLRRLRLPYTIEGVDLQFAHPVCRLRSAPPRWS